MFLNNQQITDEIKRAIKNFSRNKWQWKHDNSECMGCRICSSQREVYSNKILPQERKKISNKQPNPTHTVTRERATNIHQC